MALGIPKGDSSARSTFDDLPRGKRGREAEIGMNDAMVGGEWGGRLFCNRPASLRLLQWRLASCLMSDTNVMEEAAVRAHRRTTIYLCFRSGVGTAVLPG